MLGEIKASEKERPQSAIVRFDNVSIVWILEAHASHLQTATILVTLYLFLVQFLPDDLSEVRPFEFEFELADALDEFLNFPPQVRSFPV